MREQWAEAADESTLSAAERNQLWGRQILKPSVLYGWGDRAGDRQP